MNNTVSIDPAELRLDHRNPRLHAMAEERTQRNIAIRLLGEYPAVHLACDMLDSLYVGPAALLAVREDGETVVIDGNRQLAAVMALGDPSIFEEADTHEVTGRVKLEPEPPETVAAVIMESRWEAMRVRIRREKGARSIWGHLAHARHYRELLREGRSPGEINELYGYDGWLHGAMSVHRKVETLLAMDQVNEDRERPWDGPASFQRLERALRLPAVRGFLEMGFMDSRPPDLEGRPVPEEKLGRAAQLMLWIQGSARDSGELVQPRFDLPGDENLLERVCSDDRALELMERSPRLSGGQVMAHLSGREDREARTRLQALEALARQHLEEMRSDPGDRLEVPGDIHLSDVTYELHLDGALQLRALLVSREPERDEAVRAELQRRLREVDGQKCAVHLIADRQTG